MNICFRITTLSHREDVSWSDWGSSSSQSASLLGLVLVDSYGMKEIDLRGHCSLIQLLRLFDNLFLILVITLRWGILLLFIREIRRRHSHFSITSIPKAQLCVVQHLDC